LPMPCDRLVGGTSKRNHRVPFAGHGAVRPTRSTQNDIWVERFHQTLKRYLAKQPPAASLAILQLQLDAFRRYSNAERPHRAVRGRTPLVAFGARLKARPTVDRVRAHFRVRSDRVSKAGNVTVRYLSRLRHIGLGRAHVGQPVKLLIADDYVRVVGEDGSLLRELVLDAGRDHQPRLHSSTMS
jgi:hypothetical protein